MIQLSDRNSKTTSAASKLFYKGIINAKWIPNNGFDKKIETVLWTIDDVSFKTITNVNTKYNTEIVWTQNTTGNYTIKCVVTFEDGSDVTESSAFTIINTPS